VTGRFSFGPIECGKLSIAPFDTLAQATMVDTNIQSQLAACLNDLALAQQRQVLEYALQLGSTATRGIPGASLLPFAGRIDDADLDSMSAAIEEGCERIDADGW
jgi:hypothetical protein